MITYVKSKNWQLSLSYVAKTEKSGPTKTRKSNSTRDVECCMPPPVRWRFRYMLFHCHITFNFTARVRTFSRTQCLSSCAQNMISTSLVNSYWYRHLGQGLRSSTVGFCRPRRLLWSRSTALLIASESLVCWHDALQHPHLGNWAFAEVRLSLTQLPVWSSPSQLSSCTK